MMALLIDKFSKEKLQDIVNNSTEMLDETESSGQTMGM